MTTGQGSTILTAPVVKVGSFYWVALLRLAAHDTPLLLDLALLALIRPGQSIGLISGIIGLDVIMILTGLGAGFSTQRLPQWCCS